MGFCCAQLSINHVQCMYACTASSPSRGVCTVHARRRMYPSEQLVVRIVYMDVCCTWGYHMILVLLGETVIRAGIGVNSLMTDSLA
jgi:hypothetical protein